MSYNVIALHCCNKTCTFQGCDFFFFSVHLVWYLQKQCELMGGLHNYNNTVCTPQVEEMDSSEIPDPASAAIGSFSTPSCDLLSHTVGRPEALQPESQEQRGRLNLSDRKLSLQERSPSATSPWNSPGLNGRYIYPSLPYSPITSPHSSPRLPRRPTVESHRVSITDLQVSIRITNYYITLCHFLCLIMIPCTLFMTEYLGHIYNKG